MGAAMLKQQQSMRRSGVEMEMEESLRRITLMIAEEGREGV